MEEQGVWMTTDGLYHRGSPKRTIPERQRVQRNQPPPLKANHNFSNNNDGRQPVPPDEAYLNRNLDRQQQGRRQPPENSERCKCCPYGYHIDLDFMRICDEISTGVNLKELKKPSRTGRRKFGSMPNDFVTPPVPPRSSSIQPDRKQLPHVVKQNGEATTESRVDDVFSKENKEFWDIYNQFDEHLKTTYPSKLSSNASRHRLPSDTQSLPPESLDVRLSDVESVSSDVPLSSNNQKPVSQSAMSSLRNMQGHTRDYHRQEPLRMNLREMANLSSSNTSISSSASLSSTCSSNRFSPLPFGGIYSSLPNVNLNYSASSSGRSTPSNISANQGNLAMIRQQMASALVRMKQLEREVKTIPTLHVKINVLKEEKRLLKMQIKKRDELEQTRDAEMHRDSTELHRREDRLRGWETDMQRKEKSLGEKEFDLEEREGDLCRKQECLKRLENELQQREVELDRRESDLERKQVNFRDLSQSDLRFSPSTGSSNENHRPNTLEELAEKLNNLKRVPPPVAPKPQSKGPPRRAVVQPYIHTRTVGVNVNTFECGCKESRSPGENNWKLSSPKPYQGINVTMWKPDSFLRVPLTKSTQTESESVSDSSNEGDVTLSEGNVLKRVAISQTVETQTAEFEWKPQVELSEFSSQATPEPLPAVLTRNLDTQTEEFTQNIETSEFSSQATPEPEPPVPRRDFETQTIEKLTRDVVVEVDQSKFMSDKATFTAVDVRDRSTSVEHPKEREVYSRGTVTDVLQRRHMAVNTEEVEAPAIVPSAESLLNAGIDSSSDFLGSGKYSTIRMKEGRMPMREPVPMADASTETEVHLRKSVGALRDISVEALCDTYSRGVSAKVLTEDQSSLISADSREFGCGPEACVVAEVCTITDTLDMIDTETYMDETNYRTYSTNTEPIVTSHMACEASVLTKEQSSQIEDAWYNKEVSQVGIQAVFSKDCTDTASGDNDVNVLVCDKCSNVVHREASVSTSDHDFDRRRTIGTNHAVVTRSVGIGGTSEGVENDLFIAEDQLGKRCNVCMNEIDTAGKRNLVSVGVGGDTTLEKLVFSDVMSKHVFRSETSPTNRSFPATNPKERRRPRSHSSPALPTVGFFSEVQPSSQPSAKLSFPDPPDFSHFKWSSPKAPANEEERGGLSSGKEDGSDLASEGEDTTLEESTESIFRAEDVILRRNPDSSARENKDAASVVIMATPLCAIEEDRPMAIAFSNPYFLPAGESPLDAPVDGIQYHREISQESSSAPQSTSHSLSSLVTSSDEEESEASSTSDESACFSTTTEGSYDGHTGRVHVKRKRKVTPTKKQKQFVYPQKVPLSPSSFKACQVIDRHVTQQQDTQDKEYMSSLSSILREWFKISSQENSEVEHVQGYLLSLADVSKQVLKKIINMADGNGNTALHYSISHGNFDIVDALLESGVCEVNKPNKAGATAVMLVALAQIQEDDWPVVEKLVKMGGVNISSSQAGQTALMLAVSRGKVQMVRLLLEAGADVNVQDEDGSTALMCASEHGHLDIVKLLIAQQDCDINVDDNDGCNAFSIAMENGHKAIGVLLYAHMNFGKQSSPKKRGTAGSPSGRIPRSGQPSSAFTPISKSVSHEALPLTELKQSSRSRSLSPTSRKSSLHSPKAKQPTPSRSGQVSSSKKLPTTGGSNTTQSKAGASPQSNFSRNMSLRKSLPARSRTRQTEEGGIVKALRKSRDPQSKLKSV